MKRFLVPCTFFENQTSGFYFYIGSPNKNYHPIYFQAEWLLIFRHGIVENKFLEWLEETRQDSFRENVNFELLCSQAAEWSDSPTTASKGAALFEMQRCDSARFIKSELPSEIPVEKEGFDNVNLLLYCWNNGSYTKNEVLCTKERLITQISSTILSATGKRVSRGCRYLLPFLLNYERMSLSRVLKSLDTQQMQNLTYALALIADTDAKDMTDSSLEGFRKFVAMSQGDQLLAVVTLRNILELWAKSPTNGGNRLCDLTHFHRDLREYFCP